MKCTICGKEVKLVPSATERAAKYGNTASYYTNLFRQHSECVIKKRNIEANTLLRSYTTSTIIIKQGA